MKKVKISFTALFVFSTFSVLLMAQKTDVFIGNPVTITATPPTSSCAGGASNCSGLVTEYFIIDLSTIVSTGGHYIIGTSTSNIIDPSVYGLGVGDCFAVTPVCYNLADIQELVTHMNTNPVPFVSCCGAINSATPEGVSPPICDAITAIYTDGSQVTSLVDVLIIFGAFGNDSLTVQTFSATADSVNLQGGLINVFCASSLPLEYCVSPTDSIPFQIINDPVVALEQLVLQGTPSHYGNEIYWEFDLYQAAKLHLEKSVDGINFHLLKSMYWPESNGGGRFTDTDIIEPTLYYRLSAELEEGTEIVSNTISLTNSKFFDPDLLESSLVMNILNFRHNINPDAFGGFVIYNTEGRVVLSGSTIQSELDISLLKSGIYIIQVKGKLLSKTVKFLKI